MPEAVYQVMTMLSTLVAPAPDRDQSRPAAPAVDAGQRPPARQSGRPLPRLERRGADRGEVRRAWAALAGAWTSDAAARRLDAPGRGRRRTGSRSQYGGYRPVAIDLTGFWRPRLRGCPTRHYHAEAGTALPAIVIGIIARVGSAAGQRLGLPLGLVRADPADPSPAAHRRRLIAVAAAAAGRRRRAGRRPRVPRSPTSRRPRCRPGWRGCRRTSPPAGRPRRRMADAAGRRRAGWWCARCRAAARSGSSPPPRPIR